MDRHVLGLLNRRSWSKLREEIGQCHLSPKMGRLTWFDSNSRATHAATHEYYC